MPTDPNRAALDEAYATGMERIAIDLDGEERPAPVAQAEPPPAVRPGGFAAEQPAQLEAPARAGFLSQFWDGLKTAAPVVADALGKAQAAKASQAPALVASRPGPGQEGTGKPPLPMWLLWAVLGLLAAFLLARMGKGDS